MTRISYNGGSCAGLDITDQLLQNLAVIRSDGNLLPQPAITVEKRRIPGYKGVVRIRVGPRRARASAQDERVLTESRELTVGKEPVRFVGGAYLQFLRIDGAAIRGPIPRLIDQLDDVLRGNISVSSDFASGSTEVNEPEYPLAALQQIGLKRDHALGVRRNQRAHPDHQVQSHKSASLKLE